MDSAETEETTSVDHMRKKADERVLDKEEDYFNTDRFVKFIFLIYFLFYVAGRTDCRYSIF